jgi:hypothetical protein
MGPERSLAAVLALALAGLGCEAAVGAPAGGAQEAPAPVDAGPAIPDEDDPDEAEPVARVLSHSASQEITPAHSVACVQQENGVAVEHRDNSYYRVFDLGALGIEGTLETDAVTFGIESARSPAGSQPASVALHTLAGGTLQLAQLTELARVPLSVANQDAGLLTVPLSATVPAGSVLVVEIHTPDSAGNNHLLFVGSNAAGQTGPTFLRAPAAGCDLVEPVDLASIGFPDLHLVLSVSATEY